MRSSRSTRQRPLSGLGLAAAPLVLAVAVAAILAVPAAEAKPPGQRPPTLTLDIADLVAGSDPFLRVAGPTGPTTFGFFGTPVAGGFDADGDGLGDYAVGHMTASNFGLGRIFSGEAHLVFGDGTTSRAVDLAVPDPRVLHILGVGFFEGTASELWMGDVTGDGLGDLLVHRQNFDPGGRVGAGAVTVVVGGPELAALAASGTTLDLAAPDPSIKLFHVVGAQAGDRMGIWARVGDVDGDGVDDLITASDQEDAGGEINRGAVYVIRGGAHLAQSATLDLAQFGAGPFVGSVAKIVPPAGSDDFHLGSTNQAGDLDGNGRAEIFVAAALNRAGAVISPDGNFNGDAVGGPPGGRVWVVWDDNFPAAPWPAGYTVDLGAPPGSLTVLSGGSQNVSFGEEVLGGKDYDGDGRGDLFVGDLVGDGTADQSRPVAGLGYVLYRAERLKGVVSSVDDLPSWQKVTRILGPVAGAIGSDTVTDGDFDGDGIDDLMIGNPHDNPEGRFHAGTIHVLFGKHGRWPKEIDTAPGSFPPQASVRITEIRGALGRVPDPSGGPQPLDEGDTLAYSAAAGDVDGDGRTDVITNEMVGNGTTQVDVGNLIILDGGLLTP